MILLSHGCETMAQLVMATENGNRLQNQSAFTVRRTLHVLPIYLVATDKRYFIEFRLCLS
jgi:hypothetical protein